jgi:DisA bacterial checkpoint controller nucleotide-binding
VHPFFINARRDATAILRRLDPRFEPRVYYIQFRIAPEPGKPDIGVGPEEDAPFLTKDFATVRARAAELEKQDPESQSVFMPDPNAGWTEAHQRLEDNKRRMMRNRAWRQAVSEVVSAHPANTGYVAYCGWPVEFDGDYFVLIVQVQKDVHEKYYHLTKPTYHVRGLGDYRRERSLIEAVIVQYLQETGPGLTAERPGAGISNINDQDYLFLNASKRLMRTTAAASAGSHFAVEGLFDVSNTLSTQKYEGKEGIGRIIFARPGHPHVGMHVSLLSPVPLQSFGAVRKLLQMASDDVSLLCDAAQVYGLGRVLPTYDMAAEDVFTVRFTKQFVWDLLHGEHRLMHVRYGQASINIPGFPEEKFRTDIARVFKGIGNEAVDRLCGLARSAAAQKHGCMLVISSAAKTEAKRLDNQCTGVAPFPLTDAIIPKLTAIDGSVLIDTTGICHAIGVILDGAASPRCSPERGARYNSAIRYVYGRNDAMAVVKSEDGLVNVFPDLRPQIRRSEILGKLAELRTLAGRKTLDTEDLFPVIEWLQNHEFYLTSTECEEANRLHETAQTKLPENPWYAVRNQPITPDPDMNESYYLPE